MRKIGYIAPHIDEVALEQTGAILSGSQFDGTGTQSDYRYRDAWGNGGMGAGTSDYDVEEL
ncbi:MAG: hypothetical protein ACI395_06365 [Candidatus Cryptobacteroides sp.]